MGEKRGEKNEISIQKCLFFLDLSFSVPVQDTFVSTLAFSLYIHTLVLARHWKSLRLWFWSATNKNKQKCILTALIAVVSYSG